MASKFRWLLAGLSVVVALNATAQGDFWQRTQIGAQWGFTGSQVYFNPRIAEMSWLQGTSYGFVIRHYSDKHMGIQLEVNRVQKGWTEKYDSFWYRRRLEYWEIPLMTHVVLGKGALQAIINAGPYVAFGAKSAEYIESDGYYAAREWYGKPLYYDVEYGLGGGLGLQWSKGMVHVAGDVRFMQALMPIWNTTNEIFSTAQNQYLGLNIVVLISLKKPNNP